MLKTIDEGTNWTRTGLSAIYPLAIDPQNTSAVFVAGCIASACGVLKSTDGGASGSVSWVANDPDPLSPSLISALAIDPRNSNIVYATTQGYDSCTDTLHKSVDGGVSWSDSVFKDNGVSASCVFALVVDPQNSGNLYAAFQNGGVFKSTDGGATWNAANSGLSAGGSSYSAQALAIDPASPRTVYTVSPSGVFKSSDGGMNWNPASAGLPDWSGERGIILPSLASEFGNVFPKLAIDPQDSARVYLGIGINGVYHVFQSFDGSRSWTDSGFPVMSHCLGVCGLAVRSHGASAIYAGSSDEGLFAMTHRLRALEEH